MTHRMHTPISLYPSFVFKCQEEPHTLIHVSVFQITPITTNGCGTPKERLSTSLTWASCSSKANGVLSAQHLLTRSKNLPPFCRFLGLLPSMWWNHLLKCTVGLSSFGHVANGQNRLGMGQNMWTPKTEVVLYNVVLLHHGCRFP